MTDRATKVCAHEGLKSGLYVVLLEVFSNKKGGVHIEMFPTTVGCVKCNDIGRVTLKGKTNDERLIRVTELFKA